MGRNKKKMSLKGLPWSVRLPGWIKIVIVILLVLIISSGYTLIKDSFSPVKIIVGSSVLLVLIVLLGGYSLVRREAKKRF